MWIPPITVDGTILGKWAVTLFWLWVNGFWLRLLAKLPGSFQLDVFVGGSNLGNNSICYADCAMIDGSVEGDAVGRLHCWGMWLVDGDFLAFNEMEADRFKCKLMDYNLDRFVLPPEDKVRWAAYAQKSHDDYEFQHNWKQPKYGAVGAWQMFEFGN